MAARSEICGCGHDGHSPIDRWRHSQTDMFLFHRLRRRHQPHLPCSENWLAILHPKRFQQKQRLVKFRRDFSDRKFAIELKLRFEISGSESRACVAIEMLA